MEDTLKGLEEKRKVVYKKMGGIGDFRRGTISVNYRKCGKKNCICSKPGHPGHGPQYLWNTTIKGKSYAKNLRKAQRALGKFCGRWGKFYPKAVKCLVTDEEQLLSFFQIKESSLWSQIRTTNAIERRFREVRRKPRPMGVFSDRTSMERILFAVFTYENLRQKTITPFLALTQNN